MIIHVFKSMESLEWEKLPWTGRMCYLFTCSWEIGWLKSYYRRTRQFDHMRTLTDECSELQQTGWEAQKSPQHGKTDSILTRTHGQSPGFCVSLDLQIQADMEWLIEAVCQFYQVHLDRRKNDKPKGAISVRRNGILQKKSTPTFWNWWFPDVGVPPKHPFKLDFAL